MYSSSRSSIEEDQKREKDGFGNDVSLFEVCRFLNESKWVLIGVTLSGLLFAVTVLILSQPQFVAHGQFEMAKLPNITNASGIDRAGSVPISSLSFSIEDPNLLIGRLGLPSTYTAETIKECNLEGSKHPAEDLSRRLRVSVMKKVATVVEISVRHNSVSDARQCLVAVFEMIQKQQDALISPYIEQDKSRLAKLQALLKESQEHLARTNIRDIQSVAYLAKRDDTLYIMEQIARLELRLGQYFRTQQVSPIYASSTPVSPNKSMTLVLGLLGGLMLGAVLALMRTLWSGSSRGQEVISQ